MNKKSYQYLVVLVSGILLIGGQAVAASPNTGPLYDHSGSSGESVDKAELAQQAINPSLRPVDWDDGNGQFPTYKRQEKAGYSGYLERESSNEQVELRYSFDHSEFDPAVDTYLVVARVGWYAYDGGVQREGGVSTGEATQDLPGSYEDNKWGTVRLPIDPGDDPHIQLKARYSGYSGSETANLRVQDLTVVPADAIGRLSNDEILEITSNESLAQGVKADQKTDSSSERDTDAVDGESVGCQPSAGGSQMQAIHLYTDDREIKPDDPGRITGSIASDISNNCPAKVQVTLQVPSGLSVEGVQNVESGSGGLLTSTFVVEPGEVKSISADVTSSGSSDGVKRVESSITYFPVEHNDHAKQEDTGALEFETAEEISADGTASEDELLDEVPGFTAITAVLAFAVAVVLVQVRN